MLGQAHVIYKFAGIRTTIYLGEGHTFLYGDSFYKAGFYSRFDVFVIPFKSPNIISRINFAIHFVEGTIDYSQQILISMTLGGNRPLKSF